MKDLTAYGIAFCVLLILCGPAAAAETGEVPDYTETHEFWTCGAESCAKIATCREVKDEGRVGKYAIILNYDTYLEHYFAFPKYRNAGWDLSKSDHLEVLIKVQAGSKYDRGRNPRLYLRNREGGMVRIKPNETLIKRDSPDEWQTVRFPLHETEGWEFFYWLGGSLKHVDWFEVAFSGGGFPDGAAHHVLIDGVRFLPEQMPYTPPDEKAADLDVLIIERAPLYERYDVTRYDKSEINPDVTFGVCANSDKKHYPDKGETVTFTARIQNKGQDTCGGKYVWIMDGKKVGGGVIPALAPREKTAFTYEWKWDPADHDLTFRMTVESEDYCDYNNELTIRTNALMLKHMIERGAVAQMELKWNMLGSRSCEDYLQGQIRYMNQLFEKSVYPFAPNGIEQRVMIGKLEYCDDGHLVTLGAGPYRVGELDMSVDGGRGVTALPDPWGSGAGMQEFHNYAGRPDGAWLHELSHQIGVIDDYQLITEAGDNKVNGVGFDYRNRGIMGGGDITPYKNPDQLYSYYSPGNVMGLNVTKGKRRGYFGEYLYCIPGENTLLILDEKGEPLSDAEIKLYQTEKRIIDDVPEHEGRTNSEGRFPLKNRPADHVTTETGCTQRDNPFGPIHVVGFNDVFLIIVKKDGVERYSFITAPDFNIAWVSGYKGKATFRVTVKAKGDEKKYYSPPVSQLLESIRPE